MGDLLQEPGVSIRVPGTPGLTVDAQGLRGPRKEGKEGASDVAWGQRRSQAVAWSWSWDSLQELEEHRTGDKREGRSTGRESESPRRLDSTEGEGQLLCLGPSSPASVSQTRGPKFPNPRLQAGVVSGKEEGAREELWPSLRLSPRLYNRFFLRSQCPRKTRIPGGPARKAKRRIAWSTRRH